VPPWHCSDSSSDITASGYIDTIAQAGCQNASSLCLCLSIDNIAFPARQTMTRKHAGASIQSLQHSDSMSIFIGFVSGSLAGDLLFSTLTPPRLEAFSKSKAEATRVAAQLLAAAVP